MSEQVVQNEVEKVEVSEERRPAVSSEVFDAFMQSGETANLTRREAAAKLGMLETSFLQRLHKYEKSVKDLIAKSENGELKVDGKVVKLDVKSLKAKLPVFKSAHRGRVAGQKSEYNATQRALLAAVKGN